MADLRPGNLLRSRSGELSRGVVALLAFTVLVGNQWVTGMLWDWANTINNGVVYQLVGIATFVQWRLTPPVFWESSWAEWSYVNLRTLVFLLATAALLRWASPRGAAGRGSRFLRALAVTLVAAVLSQLLVGLVFSWLNLAVYNLDSEEIFLSGLSFGVFVGVFNSRQGSMSSGTSRIPQPRSFGEVAVGPSASDNATRLLCVAAYTDEPFADRVLGELFDNDLRAIAPSPGTDLSEVVQYCLAARRRRRWRDLRLVAVTVVTAALACYSTWFLPLGVLALYGVIVADLLAERRFVAENLVAKRWRRAHADRDQPVDWQAKRLLSIEDAQAGNVGVYHGFSPFLGYGNEISSWSFSLPITPAEENDGGGARKLMRPFTALDLVDAIRSCFTPAVRSGPQPRHDQLAGVVVQDRVFVGGNALAKDRRFLPVRHRSPNVSLTAKQVGEIVMSPTGPARHFLCIHVPSWGGEVVATTFLHLSADDRMLYIECTRTVLGPVLGRYHEVDRYSETHRSKKRIRAYTEAIGALLPMVVSAPFRVVGRTTFNRDVYARWGEAVENATEDLAYNYGARLSIRELVVDPSFHNYFQKLDAGKHLQITERHVFCAILDFLDDHGVDTTELRTRQTMLLNQGIIQSGGVSIVGNQAVGREAAATQQVGQPAGRREQQPK